MLEDLGVGHAFGVAGAQWQLWGALSNAPHAGA